MWLASLALRDVRNIEHLELPLEPRLNVFVGPNAQGKTTLLESVGLLARGRSFRTDDVRSMIRRGADTLIARGEAWRAGRRQQLEIEVGAGPRRLGVDGRDVSPGEYQGRLEVVVYSTDRLRVVRGGMRERRLYLDRGAAALWPAYRRLLRDFEKTLAHRNAALARGSGDLEAWDERFCALAAELRLRRQEYAERLTAALRDGFQPDAEAYAIRLAPEVSGVSVAELARRLDAELRAARAQERRCGRTLRGPQRDTVALLLGESDVAESSSGQARSFLLALTVATLDLFRQEQGDPAVALLDDLDSELDEDRLHQLCRAVGERGQALITTAHRGWAARLDGDARLYAVSGGRVEGAGWAQA
jgi:DNA replication and repair protein RecF